jgi:anti-anti-sigma factor
MGDYQGKRGVSMLTVKDREESGVMIFDLEGQIDGGPESKKLHDMIKANLEKGLKKFILNMQDVRWLNSLGAGILIAAYASAKREEAVLKLNSVSDRVGIVLKTSGLIPEVFEVFDSEQEALKSF